MNQPFASLEHSTAFKRKLNQQQILGVGFADLNAHLLDEYIVKHRAYGNGIRYWLLKLTWVVAKLFKRSAVGTLQGTVLLVPAEPDKDRSIGLFDPIVPLLKKDDYQLIGLSKLFSSISLSVFFSWAVKIPSIRKATRKALLQDAGGLLDGIRSALFTDTMIHSLWVLQLRRTFRSSGYKAVLVDWDRHTLQALVVIAAKAEGIKTFTFVHGAIYTPQKFVPLVADTCLVWGKKHIEFFTGLGESSQKLLVAGNPRFNSVLPDRLSTLAKYQIPATKKIILHASQNFPDLQDHEMVKNLAAMIESNDQYLLLVKSHPSQDQTTLKNNIAGLPNVILLPAEVSAKEALSMASFTIIVSSTFSIDALIAGIPVAVYQPLNNLRGIAIELVDEGKVPLLRSATDLVNLLAIVDERGIAAGFDIKAQQQFSKAYCEYYDSAAAHVIATALTA